MARPNGAVLLAIAATIILFSVLALNIRYDELSSLLEDVSKLRANLNRAQVRLGGDDGSDSMWDHDDGLFSVPAHDEGQYLLGVGKGDITGPVVELNLMGYADSNQIGSGLRQRLYSRAFIIANPNKPEDRLVYLVLDTQSGDTAISYGILDELKRMGPKYAAYGRHNVAVTGTHSHSGPGAWLNYLLHQITSKGFDKQSYRAIVIGAVMSIIEAHESLAPGHLSVGTTQLKDASINRSPYAYLANPKAERDKYEDDVDKTLTLLRFRRDKDGMDIGVLTWFAVHGTSLHGNNTLISGDNKGVAARLFEKQMNAELNDGTDESFVAGFSQANVGDTTPNILGAYCEDGTNLPCKFEDSTCGGKTQACHGRGPFFGKGDSGKESCFEIGTRQYVAAYELLKAMRVDKTRSTPIHGPVVRSTHVFVDLAKYKFRHPNGTVVSTCPAALGYSFAAGTSDGPGVFDFTQGGKDKPGANPFWAVVRSALRNPTKKQIACQAPKPILLDVGEMGTPYAWAPNIVDVQTFRVGQLFIIVSPGEATTMAGRRWREAVAAAAAKKLEDQQLEPIVLLGGPANSYTHYIATEEEYSVQRYEGASTLYGPHTLNAYINLTLRYLPFLSAATPAAKKPESGPMPPNNVNRSLSFITGVAVDWAGFNKHFGDVLNDVSGTYRPGDYVSAKFVGANPRNNLRLMQTYVAVERQCEDGTWKEVRDDADFDLVFEWTRLKFGRSEVVVTWETSLETEPGRYRLRYWGDAKELGGRFVPFEGTSGEFEIKGVRY